MCIFLLYNVQVVISPACFNVHFLGYVRRQNLIMTGNLKRKRRRARPRENYISLQTKWHGKRKQKVYELIENTKDHNRWSNNIVTIFQHSIFVLFCFHSLFFLIVFPLFSLFSAAFFPHAHLIFTVNLVFWSLGSFTSLCLLPLLKFQFLYFYVSVISSSGPIQSELDCSHSHLTEDLLTAHFLLRPEARQHSKHYGRLF